MVTVPVIVIVTMVAVQFVMVWHARHVAEAAARDGLRVARGYQATAGQGQQAADQYLTAVAGSLITDRSATVSRSATTVIVTVHGTVTSVVPFGTYTVNQTVSGPVEVFAASSGR